MDNEHDDGTLSRLLLDPEKMRNEAEQRAAEIDELLDRARAQIAKITPITMLASETAQAASDDVDGRLKMVIEGIAADRRAADTRRLDRLVQRIDELEKRVAILERPR